MGYGRIDLAPLTHSDLRSRESRRKRHVARMTVATMTRGKQPAPLLKRAGATATTVGPPLASPVATSDAAAAPPSYLLRIPRRYKEAVLSPPHRFPAAAATAAAAAATSGGGGTTRQRLEHDGLVVEYPAPLPPGEAEGVAGLRVRVVRPGGSALSHGDVFVLATVVQAHPDVEFLDFADEGAVGVGGDATAPPPPPPVEVHANTAAGLLKLLRRFPRVRRITGFDALFEASLLLPPPVSAASLLLLPPPPRGTGRGADVQRLLEAERRHAAAVVAAATTTTTPSRQPQQRRKRKRGRKHPPLSPLCPPSRGGQRPAAARAAPVDSVDTAAARDASCGDDSAVDGGEGPASPAPPSSVSSSSSCTSDGDAYAGAVAADDASSAAAPSPPRRRAAAQSHLYTVRAVLQENAEAHASARRAARADVVKDTYLALMQRARCVRDALVREEGDGRACAAAAEAAARRRLAAAAVREVRAVAAAARAAAQAAAHAAQRTRLCEAEAQQRRGGEREGLIRRCLGLTLQAELLGRLHAGEAEEAARQAAYKLCKRSWGDSKSKENSRVRRHRAQRKAVWEEYVGGRGGVEEARCGGLAALQRAREAAWQRVLRIEAERGVFYSVEISDRAALEVREVCGFDAFLEARLEINRRAEQDVSRRVEQLVRREARERAAGVEEYAAEAEVMRSLVALSNHVANVIDRLARLRAASDAVREAAPRAIFVDASGDALRYYLPDHGHVTSLQLLSTVTFGVALDNAWNHTYNAAKREEDMVQHLVPAAHSLVGRENESLSRDHAWVATEYPSPLPALTAAFETFVPLEAKAQLKAAKEAVKTFTVVVQSVPFVEYQQEEQGLVASADTMRQLGQEYRQRADHGTRRQKFIAAAAKCGGVTVARQRISLAEQEQPGIVSSPPASPRIQPPPALPGGSVGGSPDGSPSGNDEKEFEAGQFVAPPTGNTGGPHSTFLLTAEKVQADQSGPRAPRTSRLSDALPFNAAAAAGIVNSRRGSLCGDGVGGGGGGGSDNAPAGLSPPPPPAGAGDLLLPMAPGDLPSAAAAAEAEDATAADGPAGSERFPREKLYYKGDEVLWNELHGGWVLEVQGEGVSGAVLKALHYQCWSTTEDVLRHTKRVYDKEKEVLRRIIKVTVVADTGHGCSTAVFPKPMWLSSARVKVLHDRPVVMYQHGKDPCEALRFATIDGNVPPVNDNVIWGAILERNKRTRADQPALASDLAPAETARLADLAVPPQRKTRQPAKSASLTLVVEISGAAASPGGSAAEGITWRQFRDVKVDESSGYITRLFSNDEIALVPDFRGVLSGFVTKVTVHFFSTKPDAIQAVFKCLRFATTGPLPVLGSREFMVTCSDRYGESISACYVEVLHEDQPAEFTIAESKLLYHTSGSRVVSPEHIQHLPPGNTMLPLFANCKVYDPDTEEFCEGFVKVSVLHGTVNETILILNQCGIDTRGRDVFFRGSFLGRLHVSQNTHALTRRPKAMKVLGALGVTLGGGKKDGGNATEPSPARSGTGAPGAPTAAATASSAAAKSGGMAGRLKKAVATSGIGGGGVGGDAGARPLGPAGLRLRRKARVLATALRFFRLLMKGLIARAYRSLTLRLDGCTEISAVQAFLRCVHYTTISGFSQAEGVRSVEVEVSLGRNIARVMKDGEVVKTPSHTCAPLFKKSVAIKVVQPLMPIVGTKNATVALTQTVKYCEGAGAVRLTSFEIDENVATWDSGFLRVDIRNSCPDEDKLVLVEKDGLKIEEISAAKAKSVTCPDEGETVQPPVSPSGFAAAATTATAAAALAAVAAAATEARAAAAAAAESTATASGGGALRGKLAGAMNRIKGRLDDQVSERLKTKTTLESVLREARQGLLERTRAEVRKALLIDGRLVGTLEPQPEQAVLCIKLAKEGVRRRDVLLLLRNVAYLNESFCPRTSERVVCFTANNGAMYQGSMLVSLEVHEVDNVTNLVIPDAPLQYRAVPDEEAAPFVVAPLNEAFIDDPDTDFFDKGYLSLELFSGGHKGDAFRLLTREQQLEQIHNAHHAAPPPSVRPSQPLVPITDPTACLFEIKQDRFVTLCSSGKVIAHVTYPKEKGFNGGRSIHISFGKAAAAAAAGGITSPSAGGRQAQQQQQQQLQEGLVTREVLTFLLNSVAFQSVGVEDLRGVKNPIVSRFTVKVSDGVNPLEGKKRIEIRVLPPLLQLPGFSLAAQAKVGEAVPLWPKLTVALPKDMPVERGRVLVGVSEGSAEGELSFSAAALQATGVVARDNGLYQAGTLLAATPVLTALSIDIDFSFSAKCAAGQLVAILRAVQFKPAAAGNVVVDICATLGRKGEPTCRPSAGSVKLTVRSERSA